jgi:hypothetical protein
MLTKLKHNRRDFLSNAAMVLGAYDWAMMG